VSECGPTCGSASIAWRLSVGKAFVGVRLLVADICLRGRQSLQLSS
jgi:hypothetical protein